MENLFKIQLNYKKNYSFAALNSGFSLFDSLYIENQSDLAFSALKLQVLSSPTILFSSERSIDYIAAGGYRFLSCDFINIDASYLASERKIEDVCFTFVLKDSEDNVLVASDFSCKILPYHYFSGFSDIPEAAAFFVTPSQPELERVKVIGSATDALDYAAQLYDNIKDLRLTYVRDNYADAIPLPVRLCERVIKERAGNSFELSLLFASSLELGGLSPVIAYTMSGVVYCGFTLKRDDLSLIYSANGSSLSFDGLYLIDGNELAFGSGLSYDTAIFNTKNSIQLSDEKIYVLSIEKAREYHILPLPTRISEKGNYVLTSREEEDLRHDFSDYDLLWKNFSEDSRVKSILLGGKFPINGKKDSLPFQADLDVNQNKVLSKILSNDFTLIRAQTGTGVSTLFSRAASIKMKNGRNVLYITDPDYHPDSFAKISSQAFDSAFVWNILKDSDFTCYKDDFSTGFHVDESVFSDREAIQEALSQLDSYYAALEGGKSIVSSFLIASDRFEQLRDANDTIIFSPEQIGALSDDMVQDWFSTVNEIIKSVSEIESVHDHPLRLIKNKNFSYEFKSKFIRHMEEFLRCIEQIISLRDQILPLFPSIHSLSSFSTLNAFCDLYRLFVDFEKVPESFFASYTSIEQNFRKATTLIQAKEENDSILQTIRVSFFDSVFELDAEDLYTRYNALIGDKGFKAISQKHGILKAVKRYLKPNCDVENIEYILSRLYRYRQNKALIEESSERVFSMFSVSAANTDDCWKMLSFSADLCFQCYAVYQASFELEKFSAFVSDFSKAKAVFELNEKINVLKDFCDEFSVLKANLEKLIFNDIDFYFPSVATEDYFSRLYQNVLEVLSASDHLKNWCNWLNVKERAVSLGLKSVVIAIENGKISNDEIKRSFLRAFFKSVCEYNFISHPELIPEKFSVEETKSKFVDSYRKSRVKEKAELDALLSMNRFDALRDISTDSFTPSGLIDNKTAFASVFPCVICDLKQAKKLFSNKRYYFDLILLESRSSVPLEDLIWLFYAGKQVAFAGNFSDKVFFKSQKFDLSASAFDYLWSVSDEKYRLSASYYSTPALTDLKNSFYSSLRSDFRYYSVPCNRYLASAEWKLLPGTFGGEYPGANYYEAQKAVEELVSFAMAEKKKSIGIVAATVEQKKLILRLFAQMLRHQDTVAEYFTDYSRFYITSVDETLYPCDYVVFSATFAPNRSIPNAKLPDEFREFGGKDPFQAIGSVISSAKEKLLVLSSFREEDLNASQSLLLAGSAFRSLFGVLSTPKMNNSYVVAGTSDEVSIITRLRSELESRGYRTVSGIQSGRYYVDLGILGPDDSFLLGILTDHSVLSHRSNVAVVECANEKYYSENGWNLYYLRSTSCFDSFEHEVQSVLQILQKDTTDYSAF